jgi:hypothetical protein
VPSFAVKSYFCTNLGTTKLVTLLVTPKHGPSTVFISSIRRKPYEDSILLTTPSNLASKVAKNDKNDVFFNFFSANKASYS